MSNSCEFFGTEYSRSYTKHKLKPTELIRQKNYFEEHLEEGEIDPYTASIPSRLDEAAQQLVYKHILDNLRSVYQISYKHPRGDRDEKETEEKDLQSELLAYINHLYFNPHNEKVLAPPITAKRKN
ncbi:uncharacterized protein LOC108631398 [Ceratina calcarata]|uniref:Uncharacterized protein LOC108631398 n=1 Tax=Ceratina calcarata TaxID=156304 RepID=A0AAJ7JDE0_9HYME|nr:uncharacterized protein LOC108631398 [Ceratina calcarata]